MTMEIKGMTPGDCALMLTQLRDDYSGEMPEAEVDSHPSTHKVQRNWFVILHCWLGCAGDRGFFSSDVAVAMTEYRNKIRSPGYQGMRRTTREDIAEANAIISYAIWDLMRHSPETTSITEEILPYRLDGGDDR